MEHTDQEYVLKMAKDNNVKFIRLWFTDILGFLKSFAITAPELEQVTGRYYNGRREARAESQAYDRQAHHQLRQLSEQLTGLTGS